MDILNLRMLSDLYEAETGANIYEKIRLSFNCNADIMSRDELEKTKSCLENEMKKVYDTINKKIETAKK